MIIGHIGVAFAARWRWPKASLPWLLVATMASDIWRTVLAATGLSLQEANIYSHVLPWSGILAILLAVAAFLVLRNVETALLVGAIVLSHVALDMVSGWKVLWIGGPSGLDVEHFEQLEFVIEVVLLWVGWKLLKRTTTPRWVADWRVFALLVVIQASYLIASFEARPWKTRCIAYPLSPCWTHI